MSETSEGLRRKIDGAAELESVVRTMKALAASSIAQYERAVMSLDEYYRTVELGLVACLRQDDTALHLPVQPTTTVAVVFGSDQGLVGQFNEVLADFVMNELKGMQGKRHILAVGERISGFDVAARFELPNSVAAITQLIGRVLVEVDALRGAEVYLFHNRPKPGAVYEPVMQRLLPLDDVWRRDLARVPWPDKNLPEVVGGNRTSLKALIREYLFISLFRACAESLASENASRLAAMRRAEKNIDELLEELNQDFHHLRQTSIDEELFDVIAGYELLSQSGASQSDC